jgi:hypothetical protein
LDCERQSSRRHARWRRRGWAGRGHGGRRQHFADYRLRVAQVLRDYGLNEREQAPADSRQVHG